MKTICACMLLAGLTASTGWATSEPADDEFDFIEEGEANRAAREADRAPSGNIFLEEEDEEDSQDQWAVPAQGAFSEDADEDPDEGYGEDIDNIDGDLNVASPGFDEEDSLDEDPPEAGDGSMFAMSPFGNNYPLKVVQRETGSVVVELPVLVAKGLSDFGTQATWLVSDILVNGNVVAQNRQLITADAVADVGPTHIYVKTSVPLNEPEATVEIRIARITDRSSRPEPLFSRAVSVRM